MLRESKISSNHYLIKQLPQATAFIDRKLRVVYASDQWIDAFDFTYDDVIGKNLRHLFHEISADWKKVLDDCLLGMPSQAGMERYLDDEKNEKWFKWTNSPWYDDDENIIGVIIHTQ
ncbi:MAG: PAS domain-containing protein, partial [Bacteroidota bacterium]